MAGSDGAAPVSVGPYQVTGVLGRGGMGVVYAARDEALDRPVAVKVMLPHLAADPAMRARFLREARAAAAVHHDRIVPIFAIGEDAAGSPFLVMPLLKGQPLDALLAAHPRLPAAWACRVVADAAAGVAAAHAAGLVHRDIKPANLWVDAPPGVPLDPERPPRCVVLDFGLARGPGAGDQLTSVGQIVGTPAFMPPEQAAGAPVGPAADVYSLGMVLYVALTGVNPVLRGDVFSTLTAIATQALPDVRAFVPVGPPLAGLVMAMLARRPEGRPTAADVAAALTGAAVTLPAYVPEATLVGGVPSGSAFEAIDSDDSPTVSATRPAPGKFPMALAYAGVAAAGLAAAGVALLAARPKPAPAVAEVPAAKPAERPKPVPPLTEEEWLARTRALEPAARLRAVAARLRERNGGSDGALAERPQDAGAGHFELRGERVADYRPLRALEVRRLTVTTGESPAPGPALAFPRLDLLESLDARGLTGLTSLEPFRGTPVRQVLVPASGLADLSAAPTMPLEELDIWATPVADLSPLRKVPTLVALSCGGASAAPLVADGCAAFTGLTVRRLHLTDCGLADISGLRGLPLLSFNCENTRLADLSPLAGAPLESLSCRASEVRTLEPLRGCPLRQLAAPDEALRDPRLFEWFPRLEIINGRDATEFRGK